MKCCQECTPVKKRFAISITLGILFGFFCAFSAWKGNPELSGNPENCFFKSAITWCIVVNRFLIGLMIAFAGAFTHHPIFGFKCFPAVRGAILGILVSLVNAIGILTVPSEKMWMGFWLTIIFGAIYGMIIDIVASKFGGEGKVLLEKNKE